MTDAIEDALRELALYYDAEGYNRVGNQYRNAATSVKYADVMPSDPTELSGVGESVRDVIVEIQATGECEKLNDFREKYPHIRPLTKLDGVGVATANEIHRETGATTLDDIRALIATDALTDVDGIGDTTARKIERSLTTIEN